MPTQNLKLPFIAPAQAQKHITVNTAFQKLDIAVNIAVRDVNMTMPPTDAAEGERFALSDSPEGVWAGHGGEIAAWQNGVWEFYAPAIGTLIWCKASEAIYVKQATQWQDIETDISFENLPAIGVQAVTDDANRLVVSSPASLFTHAGSHHQMKLNRHAGTDTASMTFQTDFTGNAEIGLTGNDALSFKMRQSDGTWVETLRSEPNQPGVFTPLLRSGVVSINNDSVAVIPTPTAGGLIAIMMTSQVGFPQTNHSALIAYDTGPSMGITVLASGTGVVSRGSASLTGMTGDVGQTSFSVEENAIQIENRFGSPREFTYSFLL